MELERAEFKLLSNSVLNFRTGIAFDKEDFEKVVVLLHTESVGNLFDDFRTTFPWGRIRQSVSALKGQKSSKTL